MQSCIGDLTSVLALPALWVGNEPHRILSTLLNGLVGTLRLDFAYGRLSNGSSVEVLHLAQHQIALTTPEEIGRVLNPWLISQVPVSSFVIQNPLGAGDVTVATFRLGIQNEIGILAVASTRKDFPTMIESLLLHVAANQAAVGLQEARLMREQKGTSEQLEQKVAERTRQVTALNLELLGEITERDRAEDEQRKLAALVENSTDFIGVSSLDGQALFLNAAGQRMIGLEGAGQVRATTIVDYVVQHERHRFEEEIMPAVFRDGRWEGELQLSHFQTGAAIPMLHHLFFIKEQGTDRRIALATIGRDMTARKQAERILLESERKFSIMFDKAAFAIALAKQPDGWIVDVNEAWLKMYGFSREEVVGRTSLELGISRDPSQREHLFAELRQQGSVRNREMTFFTKAGATRLISCNMDVVVFGGDRYLLSTMHDVTESKLSEEELIALRDELANDLSTMTSLHEFSTRFLERVELQPLLEEVLDATINLQDADFGNVQLYDPESKGLRIVAQRGFQQDFLDYFNHVSEDSASCGRALQNQQRVIIEDVETDPGFEPHRRVAASAGFRAVQSTPLLSRAGEPLGMLSTHFREPHRPSQRQLRLTDLYVRQAVGMIERNRAEEKLRRSESYLAEGQRLSHTGSWAWNVVTGDLFWSAEHYEICGVDPEEFTLTTETARQFIHPDDESHASHAFDTAISERTDFECDLRMLRPDGTIRYVHSLAHPVFDDCGELSEYVGTIIDMTERKVAEQALRQAHAQLAHISRVLTVGELASSIAHEVNQPLGAIVTNGNASLRLLSREKPDLEGTQEAIDCMISDAMRASQVIKGIRTLVKKTSPQKAPLDVNEIIREVIVLSASELARNQVSLRTELAGDLQHVLGDRVQLQQVVLNLILNGNEAISKSTWLPREMLIISQATGLADVTVTVKDSGTGLDPKDHDKVFDSFFTSKEGGLGLGLSISRTIVEAHDGRLWCTPNEGKGATFQFTLPSAPGG